MYKLILIACLFAKCPLPEHLEISDRGLESERCSGLTARLESWRILLRRRVSGYAPILRRVSLNTEIDSCIDMVPARLNIDACATRYALIVDQFRTMIADNLMFRPEFRELPSIHQLCITNVPNAIPRYSDAKELMKNCFLLKHRMRNGHLYTVMCHRTHRHDSIPGYLHILECLPLLEFFLDNSSEIDCNVCELVYGMCHLGYICIWS